MLCEKCGKNNATTHIRSVVNGAVIEKHLCGYCAAGEGYNDIKGNNLSQILFSMLGDTASNTKSTTLTHCKCCGETFADIAKSGKCGCPECYNTFYDRLLPYLQRVHGSTHHIGKALNYAPIKATQTDDTISELRNKLSQLVKEEKYEEAAVIRDKIKRLEGESQ